MRRRPMIWSATLAVLLGSASLGAGAVPIPIEGVELDGVSMAKLRGAIALPRPGIAITELLTFVYRSDILLRTDSPRSAPYASFSTEAFETRPGYQRKRVGNCKFEQAQWTCEGRDHIAFDHGIAAGVPGTMPTALAQRILDFAMPLAADERRFSIAPYDNGERFAVTVGGGGGSCTSTMHLRRKGETFEVLYPDWRSAPVCP